jgi:hypothetical protein
VAKTGFLAMTYLQYSIEMVNGLSRSRQSVVIIYSLLKGNKGYLDKRERLVYEAAVKTFEEEADQCEKLLLAMIEGNVQPFEEME